MIDRYLESVRDRLKAAPSVDAQEVVEDLRGHIERELAGMEPPICDAAVAQVLQRLGTPEQMVDEGELSWWRKLLLRCARDRRTGGWHTCR